MITELFEFTGYSNTSLPGVLWLPEGEIKAVLQITHGMTEYMDRYQRFAADLCSFGVAVAGFDLRGHGRNAGDPDGIAGAIIAGTGHQPGWLLSVMMTIVKGQIKKAGYDKTTDPVRQLSFGTYNRKFKPNRTDADWLCSDEAELDQYLADPLVRKDISAGLFYELLASMKRTGKISSYVGWNKETPVFLLSGDRDPVGDFEKGVQSVYQQMKKAGLTDVEWETVPFSNHDLFHEEKSGAAERVRHSICDWIDQYSCH